MKRRPPRLGGRGEGWVVPQPVLVGALVVAGVKGRRWPSRLRGVRLAAAVVSGATGLYLFGGGVTSLGRQLTPFPKPAEEGSLKRDGAFGLVRHPMYGGVLLMALTWALVSSPLVLLPWSVAAGFLDAKRRYEEAWLLEERPEYEDYRASVRHSMVPFVW
jgi:protein-S-isoprenylcysteine O-methyltransferase Ste14